MSLSVVHVDPERAWSGGETQVLALACHLRDRGHRCVVACHPGGPLAARAAAAGLEVAEVACARSHDPLAGVRLRRLVRERRPDVVHFHTARAFSLAPFTPRGVARIVTRRMDYPPRGAAAYVRWLYRHADGVIAISQAVRDALASRGVAEAGIDVVPSGVDVDRFRDDGGREAARRELGIAPGRPVIAIVASLHARKGHAVLLRALARLAARRVRPLCLAAGAGPDGQGLLDLASDLGIADRVRWLGRIDDVRPVLWAADVVVLPSLAEGLGVAAIEAMAAGRALVASDVGGLREVVRDGVHGLLVPPGDDIELAAALVRCLGDGALRRRLATAAADRARDFSTRAMAQGTEAVYERVLGRRGRDAREEEPERMGS